MVLGLLLLLLLLLVDADLCGHINGRVIHEKLEEVLPEAIDGLLHPGQVFMQPVFEDFLDREHTKVGSQFGEAQLPSRGIFPGPGAGDVIERLISRSRQ